jgi:hypothetical protein
MRRLDALIGWRGGFGALKPHIVRIRSLAVERSNGGEPLRDIDEEETGWY